MQEVKSQVSGIVAAIETEAGSAVAVDQSILLIESMKMEIPVESPVAGTLVDILVEPGETVAEGQVVATVRENDKSSG